MVQIGIADISKSPSIIDKLDDVATIVNKKSKDIKGFFIPVEYKNLIEGSIEKIEYQRFLRRNKDLVNEKDDSSLLDGLDEKY